MITPIAQVVVAPLAGDESEPRTRIDWFKPRKSGKLYHEDDINTLLKPSSKSSESIALNEWLKKTEWVQTTCQAHELGMHRADVLKARIDALIKENHILREGDRSWLK